jgi:hypothetical protein
MGRDVVIVLAPFALGLPLVGLLVLAVVVGWLGGGISGLSDAWSSTIGKFLGAAVAVVAIVVGGVVLLSATGTFRQGSYPYRIVDATANVLEQLPALVVGMLEKLIEPVFGLIGMFIPGGGR